MRLTAFLLGGLAGAALALGMRQNGRFAAVTDTLGKALFGRASVRKEMDKIMDEVVK